MPVWIYKSESELESEVQEEQEKEVEEVKVVEEVKIRKVSKEKLRLIKELQKKLKKKEATSFTNPITSFILALDLIL